MYYIIKYIIDIRYINMEKEEEKLAEGDAAQLNFKKRNSGELLALEDPDRSIDSTFTPSTLWKLKSHSCLQQ